MSTRAPDEPEFYVNYLPVPGRLRRSLRIVVPGVVWLLAGVAGVVALAMRHPGSGQWAGDEVLLEGVVLSEPWPVLRIVEPDGRTSTVLLVEYGKLGADRAVAAAGVGGRLARIRGTIIQRNGRRVLELAPRAGAIEDRGAVAGRREADLPGPYAWDIRTGPSVTIEGEIVDPKCYLGAMRPGQGEVHRSCARVCIAGGIPAGLIWAGVPNADGTAGREGFCLLLDDQGQPLGERALEWVGRGVEVRGRVEWWDDLTVLRVDPGGISPLR